VRCCKLVNGMRNEWEGIYRFNQCSFRTTLNRIHEETLPKIESDFKLKFPASHDIIELNNTLERVSNKLRNNNSVEAEDLQELLDISSNYSDITLILRAEILRNVDGFLQLKNEDLSTVNELKAKKAVLSTERESHSKNNEYEKAAMVRDNMKVIENEILQEVIRINEFQEGFNFYSGCVLIVQPKCSFKSRVIDQYLAKKQEKPVRKLILNDPEASNS
jgi:hypothetical protein